MVLLSSHHRRAATVKAAAAATTAAALLALASCAPLPAPATAPAPAAATPPTTATATAGTPHAMAAPAAAPAAPAASTLQIDSARSLIAVTVRRGGVLARLGHDHVVAARTIGGTVWPDQRRAQLQFRLDQMTVDEPALRQAAGLAKQPSQDAIDGTRTNMLTRVLDADRYPLVTVHVARPPAAVRASGADGAETLRVAITLHGVTRDYDIPATIGADGGALTVTGTVNLKQTDFGLTPFSVMGGAMAVQDQLELRFSLLAQ